MKQHLLAAFFTLLLIAPAMAQAHPLYGTVKQDTLTDLERMRLKGKIKSYCKKSPSQSVKTAIIDFQPFDSHPEHYHITFNQDGNILTRTDYQRNAIVTTLVNEYDEMGRILKSVTTFIPSDTELLSSALGSLHTVERIQIPPTTVVYQYNDNGRLSEARTYHTETNNLIAVTSYAYHPNGYLKQEVATFSPDSNGSVTSRKTYNKQGLCISEENPYRKTEHDYDKNGNETEVREYDFDRLNHKTVYTYNNKGLIATMATYRNSDIADSKHAYLYDKSGRMVEDKLTADKAKDQYSYHTISQHKYNKEGKMIESIEFYEDKDGNRKTRLEYSFDEKTRIGLYKTEGKLTRKEWEEQVGENTLIASEDYVNGMLSNKSTALHMSNGNYSMAEHTAYYVNESPRTIKNFWQHDTQGNFTKEQIHVNDVLKTDYEYEIEYYD